MLTTVALRKALEAAGVEFIDERWRPRGAVTKAAPEDELNAGLPSTTRVAIENWAKQKKDKPSRSEAIRRLIEIALTVGSKTRSGGNKPSLRNEPNRHGIPRPTALAANP
jgi:hypothetical protein